MNFFKNVQPRAVKLHSPMGMIHRNFFNSVCLWEGEDEEDGYYLAKLENPIKNEM